MRAIGVLLIGMGATVIWSALQGRSPMDEWSALKQLLTAGGKKA